MGYHSRDCNITIVGETFSIPSLDLSAVAMDSAFSCFPASTDSLEVAADNFRRLRVIPSERIKSSHFKKS